MTEKWKLELVSAIKKIAKTLPELTRELRRLNNQRESNTSEVETENDTQHSRFDVDS